MTTTNKKLEYGTVELPDDEFEPKNVKVRVTMLVDQDVLNAFKKAADKQRLGYQTLMNQKLRESSVDLDKTLDERIETVIYRVLQKESRYSRPEPVRYGRSMKGSGRVERRRMHKKA